MYRVTFISGQRPVGLSVRCSQSEALEFADWLEGLGFVVLTVKAEAIKLLGSTGGYGYQKEIVG